MNEMLKVSVVPRDGEVVNFKGLCIRVNGVMYYAEGEVGGEREAGSERGVYVSMSPRLSDKHRQQDRETESTSLRQALTIESMELRKETYRLKEEVKTLKDQLFQCLTQEDLQTDGDIERQKIIKELKDSITGSGHIHKSTDFSWTQTSWDNFTAESYEALPELGIPEKYLVSTWDEEYSESLEALKNIGEMIYESNKRLESRIERLEAEREHLIDHVHQLEAQLVKDTKADSQKELKDSITGTGHVHPSTDFSWTQTSSVKFTTESYEALPELGIPAKYLVSTWDEEYSESLGALKSISEMLYAMNKRLESRVERLEGDMAEGEHLIDHVSQLEAQLVKDTKAEREKANYSQLDPLQKQLDCVLSIPKQLKVESPQNDDDAGLNMLKSFRDRDGCSFEKNSCKDTSDVKNVKNRLPTVNLKQGNHSPLLRFCQRNSIKLPPLLPDFPNIFSSTDSSSFRKDKLSFKDSLS